MLKVLPTSTLNKNTGPPQVAGHNINLLKKKFLCLIFLLIYKTQRTKDWESLPKVEAVETLNYSLCSHSISYSQTYLQHFQCCY